MLEFSRNLYVSDGLKNRMDEIMKKMSEDALVAGVYVIYWNYDTKKPEFLKSIYLKQPYFKNHRFVVTGLADSYEEALKYLADTAFNTYLAQTGDEIFDG